MKLRTLNVYALVLLMMCVGGDVSACRMPTGNPQKLMASQILRKAKRHLKKGRDRQARRLFEKALMARGPSHVRSHAATEAAKLYLRIGRESRGMVLLKKAIRLSPRNAIAQAILGRQFLSTKPKLAIQHLEKALQWTRSKGVDLRMDLARAYAQSGQTQKAVRIHQNLHKYGANKDQREKLAQDIAALSGRVAGDVPRG